MSDGIYSALSGAIAQQRSLDVVANNVANANTTGFRADRMAFRESLARAADTVPGRPDPLRYVEVSEVRYDAANGQLERTGNALDLALSGDGFFQVRTPAGDRYTRAGNFATDSDGVLRTQSGHPVLGVPESPEQRPPEIVIPRNATEVIVSPDGSIAVRQGTDTTVEPTVVGRVRIARFTDPSAVEKEGNTLFRSNARPVDNDGTTQVSQGYLETANVNAVAGMNELITTSRSFEAFQKVIDGFRNLDDRTAKELGRPR